MYGLILDSMADCLQHIYGKGKWEEIVGSADISNTVFTTHKIYDEQIIQMIARAVADVTGNSTDEIMEQAGRHFITYIDDIRNDRIIKVLGRTFKDFLNGLDSMHEYYRFSFPDLQPPSFRISREDEQGMQLEYRSRRTFTGFMHYVRGLMYEIAANFFKIEDIKVKIVQHGFSGDVLCAVFRLDFKNEEFQRKKEIESTKQMWRQKNDLCFPSHQFFEIFPYHVVFDEKLVILSTGHGLGELYSNLPGKRINETFYMTRPLGYDLTWENVILHRNNVFELTSVKSAGRGGKGSRQMSTHFIKLRGQMLYVQEWNCVMFLSTLLLDDLNALSDMGIFVNDLTFHDLSRDMVMHGPSQRTEYKLALDLEQGKAARYEEIIETLDTERRKTDDLLYSMIPKEIARSLRRGNTTVSLCEKYNEVTVLFSDIVDFASIYMHIAPHEIMIILNMMVSVFDILCDKFGIYKVETVADGFMAVSGAPSYTKDHAKNMADMAFEMLNGIKTVKDPNTTISIQIRIGLHCGSVIAGLVGHKIPHFCLFGDTVNIASKMEATGEGQRIQISQICKEKLEGYEEEYMTEEKGIVQIKGCGEIMTYWLSGVKNESGPSLEGTNASADDTTESDATDGKDAKARKPSYEEEPETDSSKTPSHKEKRNSKAGLDSGKKMKSRTSELERIESDNCKEKKEFRAKMKSSAFMGGTGTPQEKVKENSPTSTARTTARTTGESPKKEERKKESRITSPSNEATNSTPSIEKRQEPTPKAKEQKKPTTKPATNERDDNSDGAFENLLRVIKRFDEQGSSLSSRERISSSPAGCSSLTSSVESEVLTEIDGVASPHKEKRPNTDFCNSLTPTTPSRLPTPSSRSIIKEPSNSLLHVPPDLPGTADASPALKPKFPAIVVSNPSPVRDREARSRGNVWDPIFNVSSKIQTKISSNENRVVPPARPKEAFNEEAAEDDFEDCSLPPTPKHCPVPVKNFGVPKPIKALAEMKSQITQRRARKNPKKIVSSACNIL